MIISAAGGPNVISVVQHMLRKFCGTLERLVALHTDKDPSCTSLLLVKLQRLQVAEALAAASAAMAFLFAVDVLVTDEAGGHGERQATLLALVGTHPAVNGLMLGQVG